MLYMLVIDSISAAMDAVASKKEWLHKAYLEELEDHFNDLENLM